MRAILKGKYNPVQGFTLVELIIVISIISILVSVILPHLIDVEGQAKDAVLLGALGSLRSTARIAESFAVSTGENIDNGLVTIGNETVLLVNRFPAARDNNISSSGPGAFKGILGLMEVDGQLKVLYSNNSPIIDAASATNVRLILALDDRCVYYQPPQVVGHLPTYSHGVLNFDNETDICS
ncbi:MAG: prepilin-type N-terminal cleavage/methylation domain-containing protein [Reinekea sp.]